MSVTGMAWHSQGKKRLRTWFSVVDILHPLLRVLDALNCKGSCSSTLVATAGEVGHDGTQVKIIIQHTLNVNADADLRMFNCREKHRTRERWTEDVLWTCPR
eukprot:3312072-Rhodomonas_salina.1